MLKTLQKFTNNLLKKIDSGVYDLGTGSGYLIKDIIDFSNFKKKKL